MHKCLSACVALALVLFLAQLGQAQSRREPYTRPDARPGRRSAPVETLAPAVVAAAANWTDLLLTGYLSNDQLAAWSADFTTRCSTISRRFSIGKSVQGVDLWVTEISANPGAVEAKPNFKYVANMHGDEPSGRMLLPMLAEWLCANQAKDSRAKRIIEGMHLFLMPTMNPDGFKRRTRENAESADLNRNFPSPFKACPGVQPELCSPALLRTPQGYQLQPETAAVMSWTLNPKFPFTAAANLHEGAIVANIPWDGYDDGSEDIQGSENDAPDRKELVYVAKAYASNHATMSKSPLFPAGITNGAAWYPIYGSMQDWDYTAAGCMEVTLELSDDKFPPTSALKGLWADNANALLALPIAAVLGGVSGRVTAADGVTAVRGAVVSVDGNSMTTSARGPLAYYNKPLAPGSYTVRIQAPGFKPASAVVTVPANGAGVVQNFSLAACRRLAACGA